MNFAEVPSRLQRFILRYLNFNIQIYQEYILSCLIKAYEWSLKSSLHQDFFKPDWHVHGKGSYNMRSSDELTKEYDLQSLATI